METMKTRDDIGYEVKTLDNLFGRRIDAFMENSGLRDVTRMHAWIIGFLYRNRDRDVFQRDVEAEFRVARSTATNILQLMVRKGYITKEPVAYDDRLKKLILTDKGIEVEKLTQRNIGEIERQLSSSITAEEKAEFLRIIRKLKASLE